jgi:hypothetical protein
MREAGRNTQGDFDPNLLPNPEKQAVVSHQPVPPPDDLANAMGVFDSTTWYKPREKKMKHSPLPNAADANAVGDFSSSVFAASTSQQPSRAASTRPPAESAASELEKAALWWASPSKEGSSGINGGELLGEETQEANPVVQKAV